MNQKMQSKWKLFERLVAAIHEVELENGTVTWDDKINNRQFDVTIRFKRGMYDFLIVIECKNNLRPISVDKIDAFVTKARDANADKAIMVSSSGYQRRCLEVAQKHGINLFSLNEINKYSIQELGSVLIPALKIYDILLYYDKKNYIKLPEEKNILPYLCHQTIVTCKHNKYTLFDIISRYSTKMFKNLNTDENEYTITMEPKSIVHYPLLANLFNLISIKFKYKLISIKPLLTNGLDPYFLKNLFKEYEYKNIINNDSMTISKFNTVLRNDKFYVDPKTEWSYYCYKIKDNIASMILLESYQHGNLFQADFTMSCDFSGHYIEITDKKEINRLTTMLNRLRKLQQ